MGVQRSSRSPARVLIAGGGFAAIEAALALRALAGDRVRLTLISPDPMLNYRPAATLEAFDDRPPLRYALEAIAEDLGAAYHKAAVEAVASQRRCVRTSSGVRLRYDALVLATGARAETGIAGALTFRDQRDAHLMRRLLADLEMGAVRRIVFAVPSGCSWSLPMYELALLTAARADERGVEAEVSIVSPEREPLELFGANAARLVRGLLNEPGVRFLGAVAARGVHGDGWLMRQFDGRIRADRVVSAPALRGRRIAGVPATWWGFVPTDMCGRIEGIKDVYAAGDITTFPVKQGGLAAQQADRIARTIAAGVGAPVMELREDHVLRARLLGGRNPIILRTELDAWGQPTEATLEHVDKAGGTHPGKVLARYLTPYLETRSPISDIDGA